jgi:hypothetical protein
MSYYFFAQLGYISTDCYALIIQIKQQPRHIILDSIHQQRVLQSCRVDKLWLVAPRQPTCQRSIRKNLKCRTSQVARIGMFRSPSVVVMVVYCWNAMPCANCDWRDIRWALVHHQNSLWERSFWQIFSEFRCDRIEYCEAKHNRLRLTRVIEKRIHSRLCVSSGWSVWETAQSEKGWTVNEEARCCNIGRTLVADALTANPFIFGMVMPSNRKRKQQNWGEFNVRCMVDAKAHHELVQIGV